MRIRGAIRLLAGNLLVLAAIWLSLLVLTALAGDVINFYKDNFERSDKRAALPNYPDPERARLVFAEFKQTLEEYTPYSGWTRLPSSGRFVNIDEDGRRIHRTGRDAASSRSIGFFGGSTTWGTGSEDDATIPAYFDQMTDGYAVWNYGMGGHNARQNLARLANLIAEQRMPDVVVFYGGSNHLHACDLAISESLNSHGIARKIQRAITERPRGGYFYADVIAPPVNFFRRTVAKNWVDENRFVCHTDPERAERVAEALVRIWEMAHAITTNGGGRFYAFLQPQIYSGDARADHLDIELEGTKAAQFHAVYPIVREKIAQRGVVWALDVSDVFEGHRDEYLYIDAVHVSPRGNELIAQRIVEALAAAGDATPAS